MKVAYRLSILYCMVWWTLLLLRLAEWAIGVKMLWIVVSGPTVNGSFTGLMRNVAPFNVCAYHSQTFGRTHACRLVLAVYRTVLKEAQALEGQFQHCVQPLGNGTHKWLTTFVTSHIVDMDVQCWIARHRLVDWNRAGVVMIMYVLGLTVLNRTMCLRIPANPH